MISVKCYRPDGTTRSLWSRPFAPVLRRHEVLPVRGSNVIAIREGPHRGRFHVDFTPLADASGDDRYRVCLTETFDVHEDAVAAERAWLLQNWVLAP